MHAGNEFNQGGWRYANPYVRIAEDRIVRAEQAAAGCPVVAPKPVAAAPAANIVVAPPPPPAALAPPPIAAPAPPPRTERHVFTTDGLFAFDRGDAGGMARSKAVGLDQLVARLREARSLESVTVTGHTDPLGAAAYNQRLSEQRARTVRDHLVARAFRQPSSRRGGAARANSWWPARTHGRSRRTSVASRRIAGSRSKSGACGSSPTQVR